MLHIGLYTAMLTSVANNIMISDSQAANQELWVVQTIKRTKYSEILYDKSLSRNLLLIALQVY